MAEFWPKQNVEPKHSRVKWERADAETARKIVAGVRKKNSNILISVVFLGMVIIIGCLLYVLVRGVLWASQSSLPVAVVYYVVCVFPCGLFIGIIVRQIIKAVPYFQKQPNVWIFRTKCHRIGVSANNAFSGNSMGCFAFFNSKGGQIMILIPQKEYDANPVGKEYIFYKFNQRTGNLWTAIRADELDDV